MFRIWMSGALLLVLSTSALWPQTPTPTPAPHQLRGGERPADVTGGELVHRVSPAFPKKLDMTAVPKKVDYKVTRGVTVVLRGTIDKEGAVRDLKVVSGNPVLVPYVLDAVKQWRFTPYRYKGELVEVEMLISWNIQMSSAE